MCRLGGSGLLVCYEEDNSKAKFIGNGVIQNVSDGMLHEKVIDMHYVSLTITESYQDDYPLFEPLTGDDPPITLIS